jgi:site-specific DNA recombinase
MQGSWNNNAAYYRCRFAAEYAVANQIAHPRNVFVRERDVLPALDDWLGRMLAGEHLEAAIDAMTAAQDNSAASDQVAAGARETIRACEAKIARYREAIDAGGDVTEISQWINQAKAERLQAEAASRTAASAVPMTRAEIAVLARRAARAARVLQDADVEDKAAVYAGLNLVLTYQPENRIIQAKAQLAAESDGLIVGVRGGT